MDDLEDELAQMRRPGGGRRGAEREPAPEGRGVIETDDEGLVRLQKLLAQSGVASRRKCEELMLAGAVEVDGEVVTRLGTKVDPRTAVIRVDGKRLPPISPNVYLVLNKPRGVVSTMSDPEGRRTLQDVVADRPERLFHVGRLDTDTSGLILLTNDGDFAHRMAHPSYEVDKTYVAEVDGELTKATLQRAARRRHARRRPGDGLAGQGGRRRRRRQVASSSWSSTRAATGSCAGCSTTSATRYAGSPAPPSARSSSGR